MPEYGLTSSGPNIKRLDVIEEQIHTELSEKWGVNTRKNPESFLCHLIRNIADQLADLWVYGSDVYYSQYPNSAEGKNLDNAVQYGGIIREPAKKSYYKVICFGVKNATIPAGTLIASDTIPQVDLVNQESVTILDTDCSGFSVTMSSGSPSVIGYQVHRAGDEYSIGYSAIRNPNETDESLLNRFITDSNTYPANPLSAEVVSDNPKTLRLVAKNLTSPYSILNLYGFDLVNIGKLANFETVETGNIYLANGTITKIINPVAGLQSVINVGDYIAGQDIETDTELRQSYIDKIFVRSSRMIESIRSNILDTVQGVESCSVYENDTNVTDEFGRWPHSVEVVVDGTFDSTAMAQAILDSKAGGISTYCDAEHGGVEVTLPGDYGEDIVIRYQRPEEVYVWYKVVVKFAEGMHTPPNYDELVQKTLIECMSKLKAGDDVTPQRFLQSLYEEVPGVDYFDIGLYHTTDSGTTPSSGQYTEKMVSITPRQRAVTDITRIEVSDVV
jgi:hypothetical protein